MYFCKNINFRVFPTKEMLLSVLVGPPFFPFFFSFFFSSFFPLPLLNISNVFFAF